MTDHPTFRAVLYITFQALPVLTDAAYIGDGIMEGGSFGGIFIQRMPLRGLPWHFRSFVRPCCSSKCQFSDGKQIVSIVDKVMQRFPYGSEHCHRHD